MKRQRLAIAILAGLICLVVVGLLGLNAGRTGRAEEAPPILQYPTFPPTPTVAPVPTNPPQAAATKLLAASFDKESDLNAWQIVDLSEVLPGTESVWAVKDGRLIQNRTAAAGNPDTRETLAVTGDAKWTDYTITAKVYDQANATFGLVARRQGNSFYRYRILADRYPDTPKQVLEKVVDGVATPLATIDGPGYAQREWHTVAMTVAGSSIRVTLDGKLVAQATDSTLTSGQIGVYTRALGEMFFDDVTVTTP